jgi:hypothetical protein
MLKASEYPRYLDAACSASLLSLSKTCARGFEAFTNDLAVWINSATIIAIADALHEMWHSRKRAPFAVFGQAFLSLTAGCKAKFWKNGFVQAVDS